MYLLTNPLIAHTFAYQQRSLRVSRFCSCITSRLSTAQPRFWRWPLLPYNSLHPMTWLRCHDASEGETCCMSPWMQRYRDHGRFYVRLSLPIQCSTKSTHCNVSITAEEIFVSQWVSPSTVSSFFWLDIVCMVDKRELMGCLVRLFPLFWLVGILWTNERLRKFIEESIPSTGGCSSPDQH